MKRALPRPCSRNEFTPVRVVGAEDLPEQALLQGDALVEQVEAFVHRLLGQPLRHDGAGRERSGRGGSIEDVRRSHHLVDQAHRQRLLGPDLAAITRSLVWAGPMRRVIRWVPRRRDDARSTSG